MKESTCTCMQEQGRHREEGKGQADSLLHGEPNKMLDPRTQRS